jgi:hypothetical protein
MPKLRVYYISLDIEHSAKKLKKSLSGIFLNFFSALSEQKKLGYHAVNTVRNASGCPNYCAEQDLGVPAGR